MNTAKKIFDEVRVMPESEAREVLDFVGYLKAKLNYSKDKIQSMDEFDQFGAVFDGKFNRDECYDRQVFS
jgi:hypothetical protein